MTEFPIMAMKTGDQVTITEEWGTHHGTVNWWDSSGGFRVSVNLGETERVFEATGPRAARFWH